MGPVAWLQQDRRVPSQSVGAIPLFAQWLSWLPGTEVRLWIGALSSTPLLVLPRPTCVRSPPPPLAHVASFPASSLRLLPSMDALNKIPSPNNTAWAQREMLLIMDQTYASLIERHHGRPKLQLGIQTPPFAMGSWQRERVHGMNADLH